MGTRTNTTLDDLAGVIGFTATLRIAAWYGGCNIYVPAHPDESMQIVKLIGLPCAVRLAESWGTETIAVPTMWAYEEDQRNRLVGKLLERGVSPKDIARDMGLTERRVQQIRRVLESMAVVQPKNLLENAGEKAP
jgi:DNA-binding NarL/FixJ family response regulator